jgi:ferritin-like metal-binding protein YciE
LQLAGAASLGVGQPHDQEKPMSAPENLKDLYADELSDLWSANDQMAKAVKTMAEKAHDPKLKKALQASVEGIGKHAGTLKELLKHAGEEVKKEHCKGMEGLVKEAAKHTTAEAPKDGELLDIVMLAQYQRMCHYGLAGFGTAAAYAKALKMKEDETTLSSIVSDIYQADEYASSFGKKIAKAAKAAA